MAGLQNALGTSFGFCFVIFLFRLALRRDWLAGAAMILLLTIPPALLGAFPLSNAITTVIGMMTGLLALMRFGFLSMTTMLFVNGLFSVFLMTTNLSAWYASGTFFVLAVTLSLAAYAFHTSLGGQKILAGSLLDD